MKKPLPLLIILAGIISLYGCSKQLYTHQQVMQSFHTKNDVLKQFGTPDEKITSEGIEEWTYNNVLPTADKAGKHDTAANSSVNNPPDSLKIKRYQRHDKYIKFLFDSAGNVSGYKSKGVNLATTKKDNFGTGLVKVLGVTAVLIVLVGAEIANNSEVVDF